MPTICQSCGQTSGKCPACIRADALPMPEPVATGKGLVLDGGKLRRPSYFNEAQLRAARLEGARAAVEVMGAMWRPIETAPMSGLVLLEVERGDERRVFAAEQSSSEAGWHWMITVGWCGWSRLHEAWTPARWMPLPQPPAIDAAMAKEQQ